MFQRTFTEVKACQRAIGGFKMKNNNRDLRYSRPSIQHSKGKIRRYLADHALPGTLLTIVLATLLASCETTSRQQALGEKVNTDPDAFLVVDCLLPGQVRQLGSRLNYLTQRRPIKTTANDCEIRGGEYVAFDRADYSTALKIWLPMAKSGDAEAQTYVGEIYEKGLGLLPDYAVAAHWYQMAAEQGHTRAKINLGHLYEKGLGVPQNRKTALNLYRQASGIKNDALMFASTLTNNYVPREHFEGMQWQLRQEQQASSRLEQQLLDVSTTLDNQTNALASAEQQLSKTQQELDDLTSQQVTQVSVSPTQQDSELIASIEQLRNERLALRKQLRESNLRNAEMERGQKSLFEQLQDVDQQRVTHEQEVLKLNQELVESQLSLETSEQEIIALEDQINLETAKGSENTPAILQLQDELSRRTRALIDQRTQVKQLEKDKVAQVAALQDALHKLNDKHLQLAAENSQQKQQLANLTAALTDSEGRLAETESKLLLAEQKHDSYVAGKQNLSEQEKNLRHKVSQLETERQSLNKQLQLIAQKNQSMGQSRQELEGRLSEAKLSKLDYQQQLQNLEQSLQLSKQQLNSAELTLQSTQQKLQLAQQGTAQLTPTVLALQDDLAQQTRDLIEERNRYQALRQASEEKQQTLQRALATLEDEQRQLSSKNTNYAKQISALKNQLAEHQAKRQQTEQQLLLSKAELSLQQNKREQALADLSEQHSAEMKQQQAELEQVTNRFQQQMALVASQKRQISSLQDEAVRFQNELTGIAPPAAIGASSMMVASNDFPGIEIIEPPVILTRSHPEVRLHSFKGERQIIGKVMAPAGLMSLSVNGKPHQLGEHNLFRTAVPIQQDPTPVDVVVVDNKGRRAAVSFSFITYDQEGSNKHAAIAAANSLAQNQVADEISMGKYYALIIGNNNYQHYSTLSTAVNDATVTDTILRERYNFNTRLLLNADRYSILSALNDLRQNLNANDNLLIYYAGHGRLDESNQRGYWLPIDAEVDNTSNWISNTAITDILNVTEAKHILVVADSCYAGTLTQTPLARMEADIPNDIRTEWVKVMAETRARITLTSGGVEPVLDGGGGSHSIFAKAFIDTLNSNNELLEGYALYSQVLSRVAASPAATAQVPQYAPIHLAGHESGEFFFKPI